MCPNKHLKVRDLIALLESFNAPDADIYLYTTYGDRIPLTPSTFDDSLTTDTYPILDINLP